MEENTNRDNSLNDNQNTEQTTKEKAKEKHICFENHCWKKCLAMVCSAFLGGFLAFYFVADQIMHKYQKSYLTAESIEDKIFNDMDKIYMKNMRDIEQQFDIPRHIMPRLGRDGIDMPFLPSSPVKIKTDMEDDAFNIILCLKPFQNDENKINYEAKQGKITVYGSSETKRKNVDENVSFSQDFILPPNADTNNITKTKEGKKLIISVPLKN